MLYIVQTIQWSQIHCWGPLACGLNHFHFFWKHVSLNTYWLYRWVIINRLNQVRRHAPLKTPSDERHKRLRRSLGWICCKLIISHTWTSGDTYSTQQTVKSLKVTQTFTFTQCRDNVLFFVVSALPRMFPVPFHYKRTDSFHNIKIM